MTISINVSRTPVFEQEKFEFCSCLDKNLLMLLSM